MVSTDIQPGPDQVREIADCIGSATDVAQIVSDYHGIYFSMPREPPPNEVMLVGVIYATLYRAVRFVVG